jgi:non-ribosomal peptide synthetase component F
VLADLVGYWRKRLDGAPPVVDLSGDGAARGGFAKRGGTVERTLPPALVNGLRQQSARAGATLFMGLLAGFGVVLRRHTGLDDIVIGTDLAGRDDPAVENLIGFFVNQLALRLDMSGNPTSEELLRRVREATLDAYAHRELPFDRLVEELRPARVPGRAPLFQVKLVLQNVPERPFDLPGLTTERYPVDRGTAQLDLNLRAVIVPDGLLLSAEYDADVLSAATIELILAQLEPVLERMVAGRDVRLNELDSQLAKATVRRLASPRRARRRAAPLE